MKPDLLAYLGRRVLVRVECPLGSVHPPHPNIVYPINCGELPGTVSGDGYPIDAYLLVWPEPIQEVWGTVIAVIVRHDDTEDRRVAARPGTGWTHEEIINATRFQDRYFQTALAR
ncbi:inorganic pyrophosphatase [Deinococcus sp. AJ005]|uniref:inorganic pyrophosphatase n=1 Tax=Deinococcus sp. AJ005 TaxID=2652443 RepID=UPI00125CAE6E|nr:inorganic pyrophosphatase [Deinococcus sp. AJ005]QFP76331.1 inorganic pyrophosphatase [Deinococcus sp. AJ005]